MLVRGLGLATSSFILVATNCVVRDARTESVSADEPHHERSSAAKRPPAEVWLPAGLHFREFTHAWMCSSCGSAKWAVGTGPFDDGSAATLAATGSTRAGLVVGYPWAVDVEALGTVDDSMQGIFVVAGPFATREAADELAAGLDSAKVLELASNEAMREREPVAWDARWVVQIDGTSPVKAYRDETVRRILNLDEADGRGELNPAVRRHLPDDWGWTNTDFSHALDLALQEQSPECSVAPGSIHYERAEPGRCVRAGEMHGRPTRLRQVWSHPRPHGGGTQSRWRRSPLSAYAHRV